jgi:hypothetical protein
MGTNISRQQVDSTTELVQNVMNEVITSSTNQTIVNAYTNQHAEIDAHGANLTRCPLTITQNASTTALALGDVSNGLTAQLDNKLQAALNEKFDQTLKQLNEGINFGQTNVADVTTRTRTYLEQNLKNVINQSVTNVVQTTGKTDQNAKINLAGATCVDSPAGIDQKVVTNLISKNIAQTVVDNTVKNATEAEITKAVEQKVEQINKGLDFGIIIIVVIILALLGVFGFGFKTILSNPAAKIAIGALILVGLGFLGYFIYKRFFRSDSQKVGLTK